MQSAEVVLGVLRERGRQGLPCEQLYRQMFSKDLYLLAYGNIYSNSGAMTPGASEETADGMSEEKIEQIVEAMRCERYRFAPARRTYIPKKNGKLRPLGLPSWSDKLVGEVVRLLLEAYYEPGFSDLSHGFRKRRGCHTALRKIHDTWTGTVWFIEGDISDCFGSLSHEILLRILAEKIQDQRFLRLIRNMLKAGYLEDWEYRETLSGCPQGGVVSPILSNIYLHKLDEFVEQELIPQYTRGTGRKVNPVYKRLHRHMTSVRLRGDRASARDLKKQMRAIPYGDPMDPGYRRLKYVRYADDHILVFIGPKANARSFRYFGPAGWLMLLCSRWFVESFSLRDAGMVSARVSRRLGRAVPRAARRCGLPPFFTRGRGAGSVTAGRVHDDLVFPGHGGLGR
jgi:group II intron reverse transcriptase/maturase